jgi:sodium-dependent phosphate cotransporter
MELIEERDGSSFVLVAGAVVAILAFLFGVRLLGTATDAAAPGLAGPMGRIVVGDSSALGLGWLGAYALANGSVVAALALSLFGSGLLSASQLFVLIAGSRLGAAGVVVLVGLLDYLQEGPDGLRDAVSMGLLAFLVTHSVYLPVTLIGAVRPLPPDTVSLGSGDWLTALRIAPGFPSVADGITALVGAAPAFLLALGVLLGSLRLFDWLLNRIDTTMLRRRVFVHFEHVWLAFAVGLAVTVVTTSIAFSLGVIVPLYNRGYVTRDQLVPYVLGANLGTLFDTLVVAVVLRTPTGVATVLHLLGLSTLVTLVALLAHDRYARAIGAVDDLLVTDRRAFVAFAAALLLVPIALLVAPRAL